MKKQQSGFTLIELVVVTVILGILAATAAPKFIDLSGNAKNAAAQGVAGAMLSARDMAYGSYLASGSTISSAPTTGATMSSGVITADSAGICAALSLSGSMSCDANGKVTVSTGCTVQYVASLTTSPTVSC